MSAHCPHRARRERASPMSPECPGTRRRPWLLCRPRHDCGLDVLLSGRENFLDRRHAGNDFACAVVTQRVHALLPRHALYGLRVGTFEYQGAHRVVDKHQLVDATTTAEARLRTLIAAASLVEHRAMSDVESLDRIALRHRAREIAGSRILAPLLARTD